MNKGIRITGLLLILLALVLTACGDASTTNLTIATTNAATTAPATTNAATTAAVTTLVATTAVPPTATATPPATATLAPPPPTTLAPIAVTTVVPTPTTAAPAIGPGKIAYAGKDGNVYVVNPDGSNLVKIGSGRSPLFAPDGQRLVYLNTAPTNNATAKLIFSSVNVDGTDGQEFYTSETTAATFPLRWSPRNRFIALRVTQQGPGSVSLLSISTKKQSLLFTTDAVKPSLVDWTPDGDYAVWQSGSEYNDQNLYYGDPDKNGAGAVQLTNGQNRADYGGFKYYSAIRISPDGKTLAVAGNNKIFFLSLPGQQSPYAGKVINVSSKLAALAWSPDSRTLAVADGNLKLVNLADNTTFELAGSGLEVDWTRQ